MPSPRLKRVYDVAAADDGLRILVDRLWPRGLGKDKARVTRWMKEVAPSDSLRKTFHAQPERWEEFRVAYAAELAGNPALDELRDLIHKQRVTLLYAARDTEHNNARALAGILAEKKAPARSRS